MDTQIGPKFGHKLRALDKRLRIMLIATALLFVPGVGQFVAIRDLNTIGHIGDLGLVFMFVAILVVPTSLILSGATLAVIAKSWRQHERAGILGLLNISLCLNLAWFFIHPCSWANISGVMLRTCQGS